MQDLRHQRYAFIAQFHQLVVETSVATCNEGRQRSHQQQRSDRCKGGDAKVEKQRDQDSCDDDDGVGKLGQHKGCFGQCIRIA